MIITLNSKLFQFAHQGESSIELQPSEIIAFVQRLVLSPSSLDILLGGYVNLIINLIRIAFAILPSYHVLKIHKNQKIICHRTRLETDTTNGGIKINRLTA